MTVMTSSAGVITTEEPPLAWFEFLLKPDLLQRHVAALKEGRVVNPTARDLVSVFLGQVLASRPAADAASSAKAALALVEQALGCRNPDTLPGGGACLNKRCTALLRMAADVALDFGFTLTQVEAIGRAPALLLAAMAVQAAGRGGPIQTTAAFNLRRWVLRRSLQAAFPRIPAPSYAAAPPIPRPPPSAIRGNAGGASHVEGEASTDDEEQWAMAHLADVVGGGATAACAQGTPDDGAGVDVDLSGLPVLDVAAALGEMAEYLLASGDVSRAGSYAQKALHLLGNSAQTSLSLPASPKSTAQAALPALAMPLRRRLAGVLAAVESCSTEGNEGNTEASAEAGPAAREGGEDLPRGAGIAACERARRQGDWGRLVQILEESLCDALADENPGEDQLPHSYCEALEMDSELPPWFAERVRLLNGLRRVLLQGEAPHYLLLCLPPVGSQTTQNPEASLLHYHQEVARKLQEAGGARRPYLKRLDLIQAAVSAYTGNPCDTPSQRDPSSPAALSLSALKPWGGDRNPLPGVLSLLAAADRGQGDEGAAELLSPSPMTSWTAATLKARSDELLSTRDPDPDDRRGEPNPIGFAGTADPNPPMPTLTGSPPSGYPTDEERWPALRATTSNPNTALAAQHFALLAARLDETLEPSPADVAFTDWLISNDASPRETGQENCSDAGPHDSVAKTGRPDLAHERTVGSDGVADMEVDVGGAREASAPGECAGTGIVPPMGPAEGGESGEGGSGTPTKAGPAENKIPALVKALTVHGMPSVSLLSQTLGRLLDAGDWGAVRQLAKAAGALPDQETAMREDFPGRRGVPGLGIPFLGMLNLFGGRQGFPGRLAPSAGFHGRGQTAREEHKQTSPWTTPDPEPQPLPEEASPPPRLPNQTWQSQGGRRGSIGEGLECDEGSPEEGWKTPSPQRIILSEPKSLKRWSPPKPRVRDTSADEDMREVKVGLPARTEPRSRVQTPGLPNPMLFPDRAFEAGREHMPSLDKRGRGSPFGGSPEPNQAPQGGMRPDQDMGKGLQGAEGQVGQQRDAEGSPEPRWPDLAPQRGPRPDQDMAEGGWANRGGQEEPTEDSPEPRWPDQTPGRGGSAALNVSGGGVPVLDQPGLDIFHQGIGFRTPSPEPRVHGQMGPVEVMGLGQADRQEINEGARGDDAMEGFSEVDQQTAEGKGLLEAAAALAGFQKALEVGNPRAGGLWNVHEDAGIRARSAFAVQTLLDLAMHDPGHSTQGDAVTARSKVGLRTLVGYLTDGARIGAVAVACNMAASENSMTHLGGDGASRAQWGRPEAEDETQRQDGASPGDNLRNFVRTCLIRVRELSVESGIILPLGLWTLADMAWREGNHREAMARVSEALALTACVDEDDVHAVDMLTTPTIHSMCDSLVALAHPLPAAALLQYTHPPDISGGMRMLNPATPGHSLSIPLDLHFADCLWASPLLESLINIAHRNDWPAPVQARLMALLTQRPALNPFNPAVIRGAAIKVLKRRLMGLLQTLLDP